MSGRYSDNAPSDDEEMRDRDNNTYNDDDDTQQEQEDDGDDYTEERARDVEGEDEEGDVRDRDRDRDEKDEEDDDSEEDEDGDDEDSESEEGVEDDQYYDEEAYREEEYVEKEREDDGRARCLYCTICCCCLLLIIAAIITGILLSRKKKIDAAPTEAPTIFGGGSVPTVTPGSNSVPPFAEGSPNGDTTVYKDGPLQSLSQGEQEVMLIQNGESADPNFPDTYALMNWYWDDVGYPWYNEDDLADYDVEGLLCMEHIPNTNEGAEGSTDYSICRLPSSFPGDELETSTSTGYNYIMPTDCMGQQKVDFEVQPGDTKVCADVTPLINVHPPFVPTQTSPNMRRGLQENNFQNMLFMLDNIVAEQRATDEFYTRQAGTRSPTLRLTMKPKSGNVNGGTPAPTFSSGSGSSPTLPPDVNSAPSVSSAPSMIAGPTVSPFPTGNQTFEPCGVCGDGPAGALLRNDYDVSIPADIAPDSIKGKEVTCAEIEEICLAGECNQQVCSGLAEVRQACGCPGAGGPTLCSICPAQTAITKPDEDIRPLLTPYVDPGMLEAAGELEVTCANFDELCREGQCGADVCISIPEIVREPCGCEPTGDSSPTTSANNAPTQAPSISVSPTSSAQPTYKAEFDYCGICGVGPTPNPLKEDVPISIPDNLAPPQVKNGTATCAELESYCQDGYCRPLTCRVLEPIRGLCGCPNADPPCSICGPGKVISNPDAALSLNSTVAVAGFDQSTTCGQLNDLCAGGYCNADRCEQFPAIVAESCGCTDTIPDFSLVSNGDTTVYGDGPLKADSFGDQDTMLVQAGVTDSEELLPAFALAEFTITDTDYQEFLRLGFATIELCLHHAVNDEPDREVGYRTCLVPNVEGGSESASGESVGYTIPGSCVDTEVTAFTVTPSSERVCITVTDMVRKTVQGPTTITFMIDAAADSDQPGDSFYTKEDTNGRMPVVQLVDRPYNLN